MTRVIVSAGPDLGNPYSGGSLLYHALSLDEVSIRWETLPAVGAIKTLWNIRAKESNVGWKPRNKGLRLP